MLPPTAIQASGAVALIYAGAVILAFSVVSLRVGLWKDGIPKCLRSQGAFAESSVCDRIALAR